MYYTRTVFLSTDTLIDYVTVGHTVAWDLFVSVPFSVMTSLALVGGEVRRRDGEHDVTLNLNFVYHTVL
jgi:hypothetical protein